MRPIVAALLLPTSIACLALRCPPPVVLKPYPCSGTFVLSSPLVVEMPRARMVFQYDAQTGTGSIPVRGRYTGSPTAIEARMGSDPWIVVDAQPTGGTFAGVLHDEPIGRAPLQVRFAGDAGTTVSVADVGVGNVVVIAGQSNAVMMMATRHMTASGVSSLPDPSEHEPDDPDLAQWANDPIQTCFPATGSVWPELGDRLVAAMGGVPLMFVGTARSGTGLVDPPDWRVPDGAVWNAALSQIDFATGGQRCPALVLWFQGESDAGQHVSQAGYEAGLVGLGDALQAQFTCADGAPVPIVVGVIGAIDQNLSQPGSITPAQVAEIQNAQRRAPLLRSYFHSGPDTADIAQFPLSTLHFTDAAYPALLDAWCDSIDETGALPCHP